MMQSVQVIIERLKSNPEDFFGEVKVNRALGGNYPKFADITEKLDDLLIEKKDVGHIHRLWYLEPEEKEALIAAYKEARRSRFEANVFHTLLTAQEPEKTNTVTYTTAMRLDASGNLGIGTRKPSKMIAPQSMLNQAQQILAVEFEKEYAKNSNP